jgi:hypothetical protein
MRQKMEDHSSINYDVLALGYAYETVYACTLRYTGSLVILTSALPTHILVYLASVTVLRGLLYQGGG